MGCDDIPIEFWKHLGEDGIEVLTSLCNAIWRTGNWPTDWKRSIFVPLPKRGDNTRCENYRTIALISHTSKVMTKILQNRLRLYTHREIPKEQAGFRQGRGTRDHIANLRWILESSRERQKPLFLCFIDYTKAFDCVDHDLMWHYLQQLGVPLHIVSLLQSLYKDQEACVRVHQSKTAWFKVRKGLRQGCTLSPQLFNFYSEMILRHAITDSTEAGVKIGGYTINNLRYADDTTLLAESKEDLKQMLLKIRDESKKAGLRLNIKKTKYMCTSPNDSGSLKVNSDEIERVTTFSFLGSLVTDDGACRPEILRRLAMARSAMTSLRRIWKDHDVSVHTKKAIVQTMVFTVATYGSEAWTTTLDTRRRIQAFEMWCWRRMLRIPWMKRVPNKAILQVIGDPVPLDGIVLLRKLVFCGHVLRAEESLEKTIMTGMMEGKRGRGRPRTRWKDEVKGELGGSLEKIIRWSADRSRWRSRCHEAARSRPRLGGKQ